MNYMAEQEVCLLITVKIGFITILMTYKKIINTGWNKIYMVIKKIVDLLLEVFGM